MAHKVDIITLTVSTEQQEDLSPEQKIDYDNFIAFVEHEIKTRFNAQPDYIVEISR